MTEVLVDDVDEVIQITTDLIEQYLNAKLRFKKQGQSHMANSVNGSIIGLVHLLSRITDKSAQDWFIEFGELSDEDDGE